jgi:hypothetical protein
MYICPLYPSLPLSLSLSDDKNDHDYEVVHKFTASNLPMPVLGGELEFQVTPFPTEKSGLRIICLK